MLSYLKWNWKDDLETEAGTQTECGAELRVALFLEVSRADEELY